MQPIRGTHSLKGIVASEVLRSLGLRMAVLLDATSTEAVRRGAPGTEEERALRSFLAECEALSVLVRAFGIPQSDILECLPEAVCHEGAPGFPGWMEARTAFRSAREDPDVKKLGWKRWYAREYGLRISDPADVAFLARAAHLAGMEPASLPAVMAPDHRPRPDRPIRLMRVDPCSSLGSAGRSFAPTLRRIADVSARIFSSWVSGT